MDGIDLAAMRSAQLGQEIGIALASKAQKIAKDQGQAAVALLEKAAQLMRGPSLEPNLGKRIDVLG